MREAAMQIGYEGPSNMAFLRLENICLAPIGGSPLSIQDLNDIQSRFNVANGAQLAVLQKIPCN